MNFRRESLALERDKLGLEFMAQQGAKNAQLAVTIPTGIDPDTNTPIYETKMARDAEAAKKARETVSATEKMQRLLQEAREFRKNTTGGSIGNRLISTESSREAERISGEAIAAIKEAESLGALDAGVLTLGKLIFAKPDKWLTTDKSMLKSYDNFEQTLLKKSNARLRQYMGPDGEMFDPTSPRTAASVGATPRK
jgi:hypothetical protein